MYIKLTQVRPLSLMIYGCNRAPLLQCVFLRFDKGVLARPVRVKASYNCFSIGIFYLFFRLVALLLKNFKKFRQVRFEFDNRLFGLVSN